MQLEFKIDKLTRSIEDAVTGEIFLTEVLALEKNDLQETTKKNGWKFNWKIELSGLDKQVYKLVIVKQPSIIQGLVSLSVMPDHIFMSLIETAPHNFGKAKKYMGAPGNLVAYVCKRSFELGFDGYVAFTPKTKLITHYEKTLGAVLFGQRMFIQTQASLNLIGHYYPNFSPYK